MIAPNDRKLESLDFITLKIKNEFGVDLTVADENLLSKEKSPFSTLRTLTEYLTELLANSQKQ